MNKQGWMKESIIIRYLNYIHIYNKGKTCILLLDVYPAHRTKYDKEAARVLCISLI